MLSKYPLHYQSSPISRYALRLSTNSPLFHPVHLAFRVVAKFFFSIHADVQARRETSEQRWCTKPQSSRIHFPALIMQTEPLTLFVLNHSQQSRIRLYIKLNDLIRLKARWVGCSLCSATDEVLWRRCGDPINLIAPKITEKPTRRRSFLVAVYPSCFAEFSPSSRPRRVGVVFSQRRRGANLKNAIRGLVTPSRRCERRARARGYLPEFSVIFHTNHERANCVRSEKPLYDYCENFLLSLSGPKWKTSVCHGWYMLPYNW